MKHEDHSECFQSKKNLINKLAGFEHIRTLQRISIKKATLKQDDKVDLTRVRTKSVPHQLSCISSAELLGYKSAAKGAMIQKQLETDGIVKVTRSVKAIGKIHILKYKENYIRDYSGTSCRFSHSNKGYGTIFRNECNELAIADTSTTFIRKRKRTLYKNPIDLSLAQQGTNE